MSKDPKSQICIIQENRQNYIESIQNKTNWNSFLNTKYTMPGTSFVVVFLYVNSRWDWYSGGKNRIKCKKKNMKEWIKNAVKIKKRLKDPHLDTLIICLELSLG